MPTASPGSRALLVHAALAALAALGVTLVLGLLAPPAAASSGSGDAPVVRVGTEGTYPPFSFEDPDTGETTGYDVEVMQAVAEEAGWDLELVQAPFDSLFAGLDAGRIDAIANQVTITPEREARYLFTRPYTYSRGVVVVAASNERGIDSIDDLDGLVTAESETSNWAQVARDAGAQVQAVEGFAQAAELLVQGRVDAIVNDDIAVLDYLASTGSDEIEVVADAGEDTGRQALVFRQSDPQLREQADEALQRLADDGTLQEISESYFAADVSVEGGADPGEVEVEGSNAGRSTWQVVRETAGPMLLGVVRGTVPLTVISFAAGLVIALGAALASTSRRALVRLPARGYISLIRGTPLLVQLFIVFFGLPELGLRLPGFAAACLALSLNVGGYAAEVVRAAILSVPRGQREAATAVGMGRAQVMRLVVLPQAARIAVPPLSNTLLSLVKDTSLVSIVLVTDLFRVAQNAASVSGQFLVLYSLAAAYFWVICLALSWGQQRLERRLERFAT